MKPQLISFVAACLSALAACGAGRPYASKSSAASLTAMEQSSAPASPGGGAAMQIPEQLVIEGNILIEVDQVAKTIDALRTKVNELGGRIVTESLSGAQDSWSGTVKVRIPPQSVDTVVTWLGKNGTVLDKNMSANDVSKELFDQELEVTNQKAALDRLAKLLEQGGLNMADVLAIEKEMTRIRGRIDEVKGAMQFTKDRVAYATLDLRFTRRSGEIRVAQAKVYPGARAAILTTFPRSGAKTRVGAGFVLHASLRNLTMEVDVFGADRDADPADRSRAVVATMGGAFYSDFLGRGRREFLNPYLGFRAGYGYVDASTFALQAEFGIELWKTKHVVFDANVRGSGFIGKESTLGLVSAVGAIVAF